VDGDKEVEVAETVLVLPKVVSPASIC